MDITRSGKFSLIIVVDKGIEISSKARKKKLGDKNLERNLGKNALNRKKILNEYVFDDRKKMFDSLLGRRPQPY